MNFEERYLRGDAYYYLLLIVLGLVAWSFIVVSTESTGEIKTIFTTIGLIFGFVFTSERPQF